MPNPLVPSDILSSASDELGDTIAAVRRQMLGASGKNRTSLEELFDQLIARQKSLVFQNLKVIDRDPEIIAAVQMLATQTQQIAKVRREMTTAKQVIDGATKVVGIIDQLLKFLGKVGALG